jgi:hypothetical protein
MKIKNIFSLALGLVIAAGFASCTDEPEYTPASQVAGMQVYFPETNPTKINLEQKDASFEIELAREVADKEAGVALAVTGTNLEDYTFPKTVTFPAGEKSVKFAVEYKGSNLEYEALDTFAITVNDEKNVSPYSISKYEFVAGVPAPWSAWISSKAEWVAAGYDAAAWPLGDASKATCDYTYSLYWAGVDAGLNISYRQYLLDPTVAQFKIDNWGSGVPLIIDYNPVTHNCQVASQYCADNANYGAVTVSDISYWQGDDFYASYPCTYNPETGLFVLNVAYWVPEGSFGYGPETCQVAGFYIPDYSVDAEYLGIFTDKEQKAFAQIALNGLGVDAEKAVALVVTAADDATAVADALAAGEVTGTDLVAGYNNIAIEEGMTGELQVVVASVVEGAAMDVAAYKFEYYGGGANPWNSLGMGLYTDGIIPSMYNLSSETYEVEILENNETPGLYRVVKPYGEAWPHAGYNAETPAEYFEIDATDAEGVLVMPQMLGVNLEGGDTALGFASYGAYMYNAGKATLEQLKGAGYLGKVIDGVIKLPTFANGEEGTDSYMEFQGVVYYGSKAYYGCEGFKVVLPEAVASQEANAPAKVAASKFARSIQRIDRTPIDKNAKRINPIFGLVNFK